MFLFSAEIAAWYTAQISSLGRSLTAVGKALVIICSINFIVGCTHSSSSATLVPELVDVEHDRYFDQVRVAPDTQLAGISKIYIEDVSVSMNSYWLQKFRGQYNERDLERIKTTYGGLLKKSLAAGVEKQTGFTLVDSASDADVIFRPALEALNLYAPDLGAPGIIDSYVRVAGNATFNVLLVDPASGTIRAQFIDHSETSDFPGRIRERATRLTNTRNFDRLMDRWSRYLMTYLAEKDAFSTSQ